MATRRQRSRPHFSAASSAPLRAAETMAEEPRPWMEMMSAPVMAAERTAPWTWNGMSWTLRSRKTLRPRSRMASTMAGPSA